MANGPGGGGNRSRLGILGRSAIYAGATVGAESLAPGTGAAVAGTAAAAEGLTKVIQGLQGAVEKLTEPPQPKPPSLSAQRDGLRVL